MSKDMLGSLVRASVRLTQPRVNVALDVINRLAGNDAEAWEKHLKHVLRDGLPNVPSTVEDELLETVGEPVELPACERFVSRDKFVVDRRGELPISYLGDNFKREFLGLVEENVPAVSAEQRKLRKRSVDAPIIAAHGGEEKVKIALAHVFEFLKTADHSRWFIFYVLNKNGKLWAVGAHWYGGGWFVRAYSVACPFEWYAGNHVVFC